MVIFYMSNFKMKSPVGRERGGAASAEQSWALSTCFVAAHKLCRTGSYVRQVVEPPQNLRSCLCDQRLIVDCAVDTLLSRYVSGGDVLLIPQKNEAGMNHTKVGVDHMVACID
jgi:hypothetical protein